MKRDLVVLLGTLMLACGTNCWAGVKRVHVIFKTHLDVGFTDLASKVERTYVENFIPRAIDVATEMRASGSGQRYIWTTGSWLIYSYLKNASPEQVRRLRQAIANGDIVWNAMPYTVESEMMSADMFRQLLRLSQSLDREFGKHTISAKMTDVPGHTRSIVSFLSDAGIRLLHVGVNGASTVPDVPPIALWKNSDGKSIILVYQKEYGADMILPGGDAAVSINFTHDNQGPHTLNQVKEIYKKLEEKYPGAEIFASTLDNVARELEEVRDRLPVITSEIGDTWIHGYGSSPLRIARYRELSRLFSRWIEQGRIDPSDTRTTDFVLRLGMIPEHTWGLDVKTFLKNWDKYDFDSFTASRRDSAFVLMESSWREVDENVDRAVEILPKKLRNEARKALTRVEPRKEVRNGKFCSGFIRPLTTVIGNVSVKIGPLTYETFCEEDYVSYRHRYLRHHYDWALADFGKPGLDKSGTTACRLESAPVAVAAGKKDNVYRLAFDTEVCPDPRVLPQDMTLEIQEKEDCIELDLTIRNKPANRLPEAYWFSFNAEDIVRLSLDKMGQKVNPADVVKGGNRQMHAIDEYVDIYTSRGGVRIISLDAPLVSIGQAKGLNYSTELPDIRGGVHFCLYNNLWGTNFSMWFEGTVHYRFILKKL